MQIQNYNNHDFIQYILNPIYRLTCVLSDNRSEGWIDIAWFTKQRQKRQDKEKDIESNFFRYRDLVTPLTIPDKLRNSNHGWHSESGHLQLLQCFPNRRDIFICWTFAEKCFLPVSATLPLLYCLKSPNIGFFALFNSFSTFPLGFFLHFWSSPC